MEIAGRQYQGRTYIMGILNVTPDSFSDGGHFDSLDRALFHTEEMIKEGADMIDIGGESTRPGYTFVEPQEEIERIAPVIEAVKKRFDIPVSCDTYKSAVAEEALRLGADLINDIWGFRYDPKMAAVVKRFDAACCLMHNRTNTQYGDFCGDVLSDLQKSIDIALKAGIRNDRIMTDPGVGFAKSYEQNLEIINRLELLHTLGLPVLLGTSRKSVIGLTLNLPADERVEGTIATTVLAVIKKCLFVRVHDVKENKRAVVMTERILGIR